MPTVIDTDQVQRLIAEENERLVELLPAPDYAKEHIAGAISIPLTALDDAHHASSSASGR